MGASKVDEATNLDQLINRQMRLWDVQRQLAREGGGTSRERFAHLKEGPWITLSRQTGSGGSELARRLGEKLEWPVFDKEILSAIAQHDPSKERILQRLDEHAVNALEDYLTQLMFRDSVSQVVYVRELLKIIWGLARQGRTILVGRGANWFLDSKYGLRVRVVAPLEQRAARLARSEGLHPVAAEHFVREEDEKVAAFIRQIYRKEIEDPLGYDMILNLGEMDQEAAVGAILVALHRKLKAPVESTRR